ncbi:MAG: hypothetical protein Q7K35_04645 [bacterium]|nr:hypothetical protein [bacterium]
MEGRAQNNNIHNWIEELANEKPNIFGEFFYDDIRNYLNSSNYLDNDLMACKSKGDVKKWLDKVSGYIIMNLDTENIINEYFSKLSNNKIKI